MRSEILAALVLWTTVALPAAALPPQRDPVSHHPFTRNFKAGGPPEYPSLEAALLDLNITTTNAATTSSHLRKRDYLGRGTVYLQQNVAGSCGITSADHDGIVALSNRWMQHQYRNPLCGHKIWAWNDAAKRIGVWIVRDTCDGCADWDVDFSVGGWEWMTGGAEWGRFDVRWGFYQ